MAAPFTIEELEGRPEFGALSMDKQKEAREAYFSQYVFKDPAYEAMPQEARVGIARMLTERGPVFANPDDDQVQNMRLRVAAAQQGDVATVQALKADILAHQANQNMLIGAAVNWSMDKIDDLLHPGKNKSDYQYGPESQKLYALALQGVASSPTETPESLAALDTWGMAVQGIGTLAEDLMAFGAVSGLASGTKAAAGLARITEGWASRMPAGVLQRFVSGLGIQTAEGLAQAAYSGFKTAAVRGLNGEFGQQNFTQIAAQFGTDLAFNYVAWGGLVAARTALKVTKTLLRGAKNIDAGAANVGRDTDAMVESLATDLQDSTHLNTTVMQLLPEEMRAEVQRNADLLAAAKVAAKLRTPEDSARVLAMGAGFGLEKRGSSYIVSGLEDGIARGEFANLEDATQYALRNANVATPPPVGGVAASSVRTEFRDVAKAAKVDDPQTLAKLFEDQTVHAPDSREFVARNLFEGSGADMQGLRFKRVTNDELFRTASGEAEFGVKGEVAASAEAFRNGFAAAAKEGVVYVPTEAFKDAAQEALWLDGLRRAAVVRGGDTALGDALEAALRPGTRGPLTGMSRASYTALSAVAKTRWGSEARVVRDELGSFHVTVPATEGVPAEALYGQTGRQVVLSEPGEASFRLSLMKELQTSGVLSSDQIGWAVEQSTGLRLKEVTHTVPGVSKAVKGATLSTWQLEAPGGEVVGTYNDLKDILQSQTLFGRMIQFPEQFGPKAYVSNFAKGELTFEGPLVEGRLVDIFDTKAQFGDAFEGTVARHNKIPLPGAPRGESAEYIQGTRTYVYRPYEGAAPMEFTSLKDLQHYAALQQSSLDSLSHDAQARGYALLVGFDGSVTITDGTEIRRFATRKELQKFYKDHPVPVRAPDIPGTELDKETQVALDRDLAAARDALAVPKAPGYLRRVWNFVTANEEGMRHFGVSQATMAAEASKTGNRQFLLSYQNLLTSRRLTNIENRKYVQYVSEVWSGTSVAEREMLAPLLSVDRTKWQDTAQALYGKRLSDEAVLRLDKQQTFLDTFAKANGLDGIGSIYARKADIQAAVQKALNTGKDLPDDAQEFLRATLGPQAPRSLNLFAQGLTRTDLLNFFDEKDPAVAMMAVIDKVHRQRFFAPYQKQLAQTILDAHALVEQGKMSRSALAFFQNTIDESQGIRTSSAVGLGEKAHRVSYALAGLLNKSKLLKNLGLAEEVKTDDLIGKLGALFTNNSQAFRAWAVPRNLTQVYLVGAITGNGKMWSSLQYVLDHPEYIDILYSRGAMQESILSMGNEAVTPLQRIQRIGLAPLEVSDAITRATAIRAAEVSLEQALPRYSKGITNAKQFLREANADFLAEADQVRFLELLKTSKEAGSDFLGQQMQTATMGDYSRGALGYATRGVIGRLFGKMGTYPLFTVELYRKLLTSGSVGTRMARLGRLAATSYAIYYAFQAAGASYDGFLWSDPFSFSGGPYWTILTNMSNAIGDRPENKLARATLRRQALSALVPGAMLAPYAKRALDALDQGDAIGFLKAMGTVPMSQEERLRRL